MKRPKMIIFDAGRTLIDYTSIDTTKGVRAIMPYISSNPRQMTAEQIDAFTNEVFEQFEAARKQLFEVHEQTILKLVYELMDIKLSITVAEVERIIWSEDSVIEAVDGAVEMVKQVADMGIRTAVISNLDFSGYLLKSRLDTLFPDNRFEFVVASSDYGVRKPDRKLFEVGIVKAGLKPEEIWYVGDKIKVDVAGSSACGMVPVLYKFKRNSYDAIPADLIAINDYDELTKLLKSCD